MAGQAWDSEYFNHPQVQELFNNGTEEGLEQALLLIAQMEAQKGEGGHSRELGNATSMQRGMDVATKAFLAYKGDDEQERKRLEREQKKAEREAKDADIWIGFHSGEKNPWSGAAEAVAQLGYEVGALQAEMNALAQRASKKLAEESLRLIEEDRRRRGFAERSRYPDRGGMHYLERAIERAATSSNVGSKDDPEYVIGFDSTILDEGTIIGAKGSRGYWRAYEFGRSFIMPKGMWRTSSGRFAKRGDESIGEDRFEPRTKEEKRGMVRSGPKLRNGGKYAFGLDRGFVPAKDPKMNVLHQALDLTNEWASQTLFDAIKSGDLKKLLAAAEWDSMRREIGMQTGMFASVGEAKEAGVYG